MPARVIVIAGAGPAGCAAAIALRQLGYEVVLLERATASRPNPGECLPPKVEPLLALLGVAEPIEGAGFARMTGARVASDSGTERFPFDPLERQRGYQVDRSVFDEILRTRARQLGARFLSGVSLLGVEHEGPNPVATLSTRERVRARYVIDATGAAARTGRARNALQRGSIRIAAFTAWFRGTPPYNPDDPHEGLLEVRPDGWLYTAARSDGLRNVTVAVSADALEGAPTDVLFSMLRKSRYVGKLIGESDPATPTLSSSASRVLTRPSPEPRLIAIGDASSRVDPLTAQGVYKALSSGLAAAAVVRTSLERPEDEALASTYFALAERTLLKSYSEQVARLAEPFSLLPFWGDHLREHGPARADEALRSRRRAEFLDALKEVGGARMRVKVQSPLPLEDRPVAENGWIKMRRTLATKNGDSLHIEGVREVLLAAALDGRPLAQSFDAYAVEADTAPSSELARSLIRAVLAMIEQELAGWEVDGRATHIQP